MEDLIYFTDEEILQLHKVEANLKRAYLYEYKRATTSHEDSLVREIMSRYGFKYNCSSCPNVVYNMYKQAGEIYFRTKNRPIEEPSPIQNKEIKNGKIKKGRNPQK